MSELKGSFRKYIFKSDSGYVVGLFKVKDASEDLLHFKNKTITFTGYFHELNESDLYLFSGSFKEHERYGEQFVVDSYTIVLPEEKDKIVEFLSSDLFPTIGEAKATKIVEVMGKDVLNIIIDNPNNLLLVPGVSEKQKDIIYNNLMKYQYSFQTIVELTKKGLNMKDALSIYNHYKENTMNIINTNPYLVIDNVVDVNFKKIDGIRNNFSILENDIRRVEASIKYVIKEVNFSVGNTYLEEEEIINYVHRAVFILDNDLIHDALSNLVKRGEVVYSYSGYQLLSMKVAEEYIAKFFSHLSSDKHLDSVEENDIKKIEDYFHITYNEEQKRAIMESIKNRLTIITGGPGTGKTTIIKGICKLYQEKYGLNSEELEKSLALVAPTGRAAKRIAEQTNHSASTIHRFLKWNKDDDTFRINEENKSNVRFIIIDEASMIDTYLLYNLLLGLRSKIKIVVIGDYNQLPSVGGGQVLKDIIESDCFNVVRLEQLYRQAINSNITLFAHNIVNNNLDLSLFNKGDDLIFIPSNSEMVKNNLNKYLLEFKDMDINKFQVLAPIYKGDNGIDDLNYYIQSIINPINNKKNNIMIDGVKMSVNDKVINLVNMPDDNVYNGDIGSLARINNNPREVYIDYGEYVKYSPSNFSNLKLGYAISIHKSQGSEFDVVIVPVLNKYGNMLYKKLIYTAVTRAKKKLIIIGEEDALYKAITNNRENNRKTNLKNFILSMNTDF